MSYSYSDSYSDSDSDSYQTGSRTGSRTELLQYAYGINTAPHLASVARRSAKVQDSIDGMTETVSDTILQLKLTKEYIEYLEDLILVNNLITDEQYIVNRKKYFPNSK
jgi:hypothetical protein